MTAKVARWETRSLECWAKAKELRRDAYDNIMRAEEEGKQLIGAWGSACRPIINGFGGIFEECGTEAFAANVGWMQDVGQECHQAADDYGFQPDLCPYVRAYIGSMLANKSPFGSFPKHDLFYNNIVSSCAAQAKQAQFVSEYFGIPYYSWDSLRGDRNLRDPEVTPAEKEWYIQSLMGQYEDYIKWLEEKSGRRWDWEPTAEELRLRREADVLMSQVHFLNQNIPATLDTKTMYSLMVPNFHFGGKQVAVDFYRTLLDEVKWRVENKIAALATERCRLIEDEIPQWYALRILRYVNKWGATFVTSPYAMNVSGVHCDGGRYVVPKSFEEEGRSMRTREDALRYLAEQSLTNTRPQHVKGRVNLMGWVIQEWKVDGAMLRSQLGCTGFCMGGFATQEISYVLRQKGFPVMVYQASQTDKRSWNEAQVIDNMEAFLEGTLGLERLEE